MIVRNSLLLLAFNFIAHFLNYLYHLAGAKFLTPTDFGLLQSFIALNYFLAVFISSYSLAIIKFINTTKQNLDQTIADFNRLSAKLTLVVWLVFVMSYPMVKILMHLQSPVIFFIFSLQLLFAFFPTVYSSLFLAKLKFFNFSLLNILTPLLKLVLAALFLFAGFKVFGAIAALTLTTAIGSLLSLIWIIKHFGLKLKAVPKKLPTSFYAFFCATFISQLSLTSIYSSDIILTRYYLPHIAGFYSAASLLARTIFFVSASVLTVAFPVFAKHKKNRYKEFKTAFMLIAFIGIGGIISYTLLPDFFVRLLATRQYLPASRLLPLFSIFMVIFSLFNLIVQFMLNINIKQTTVITSSAAILQIVLIVFNHSNLQSIITNSAFVVSIGLIISLIYLKKYAA